MVILKQFDIYLVNLDPTKGSEMKKTRPVVIISPAAMNKNLNTVLIAPLTTTRKLYPSRVFCDFNGHPGEIVLDQVRGIDKKDYKESLVPSAIKLLIILKRCLIPCFHGQLSEILAPANKTLVARFYFFIFDLANAG